ncbi:hypothetical protein [Kitasatospora sp. MBT63]|uniref:hypothetical protein n=1 Tax=Kitasatospora sp. MBT63 TaxID=1444768 RepID=UPI00068DEBCC|nr:hypothetical protein [Kitasatospora sp. MBT63]
MTDNPGWTSPGSSEPADGAPPQAATAAATPGPSAPSAPEATAPQAPAAQPTAPQDGPQAPAAAPQDVPPPSQWGAPGQPAYGAYGGPGYGPGPGWGGRPPYGGHPGWGAPPSPKPGVIPLRPLGVGELLDGSFTTVRKYWRTTLALSLGFAAFTQTVETVLRWWAQQDGGAVADLVAALVPTVLQGVLGILLGGLLTIVVSKGVLGEQITVREAWQSARSQLGRLTGLTFLTFLIIVGVFAVAAVPPVLLAISNGTGPGVLLLAMLMALIAGGVAGYLGILFSLAPPALMLERQGVLTSLSRSRRLVRGSWWRIFGVHLLTSFILGVVSTVAVLPFLLVATVFGNSGAFDQLTGDKGADLNLLGLVVIGIGSTLVATVTIPVNAAVTVLLYIDRRIRREALDIELARAAGVSVAPPTGWAGPAAPGPASPGPTVPGQSTPPGA